ncbi:hypothetical protein ANN_05377 [Periplaneta americana]|uniref:Uncharacterized protein n=1 Tax=Periplaneta americana TaxID=6978 RepID=A0ABQ8TD29_PERAM|nr:hypothetical protein ANN_05377 [Periplaneta americana]
MGPGSNTGSYPAFAHIGLRENPGKNLNQNMNFTSYRKVLEINLNKEQKKKVSFPVTNHNPRSEELKGSRQIRVEAELSHLFRFPRIPPVSFRRSPGLWQLCNVGTGGQDGIVRSVCVGSHKSFAYENIFQIIELFRITFQHKVHDRRRRFSFDNLRQYIVVYCNASNCINDDEDRTLQGVEFFQMKLNYHRSS